jgi:hypothetical protein
MTDRVILRHAKLKSYGEIGGSLDHTYRLIDTPNADLNRTDLNEHDYKKKTEVVAAIKNRIDQRVREREGNVLCVEYLITASPTWDGWGTEKETEFFDIQKKRLVEKWGAENVISTHIHRDETTPHLIVYIVPFDEEKKVLNCKKWLDGRKLLQAEQTDAAEKVAHLGLTRGIKNSKAEHRTIKQHYEIVNQINEINEFSPSIDNLPEPTLTDRLNPKKYAERVLDEVLPDYKKSKIEATQALHTEKEVKALRKIVEKAEPYLNAIEYLSPECKNKLDSVVKEASDRLRVLHEQQKKQELEQYEQLKNTYYNFENYVNDCIAEKNNTHGELDNRLSKTEKWLKKSKTNESEYQNNKRNNPSISHDEPDYYIQTYQYQSWYEKANRQYKEKVAQEAEAKNIESVVLKLKEQSDEPRVLNDLQDFDTYVLPTITEFKLESKAQAEQRIAEQRENERRSEQRAENERIQREALEKYQHDMKLESERNRAVLTNSNNNDTEQKIDRDNDFSM